jgi:hypothetical protein
LPQTWRGLSVAGNKSAVFRPDFAELLADVKGRIQAAQTRAVLSVNAELVRLHSDIGPVIDGRQEREGWGAAVILRLAEASKNELPELKGFSERNIKRMLAFHREYSNPAALAQKHLARLPAPHKVPQPAAQIRLASKLRGAWRHRCGGPEVMSTFTESVVEDAALAWLESVVDAIKHGAEVCAGIFSKRTERGEIVPRDRSGS